MIDLTIDKKEVFYGGILSGSLSAIISSAIKKISNGKPIGVSATVLLIEGNLDGYIENGYIIFQTNN